MRPTHPILAVVAVLSIIVSAQPSSFDIPLAPQDHPLKWATRTIPIALSSSLSAPSPAIKPGTDVLGAVHKALMTWSKATNIKFVEVMSGAQSVSPSAAGDRVNLVTIAPTEENLELFSEGNTTARTRVFFDRESSEITEADVVINPYPFSDNGTPIQFSSDETPGTYDLESTLTHEIGHVLGLTHSRVLGATMQPTQALNGTYGVSAITERTLSDADVSAIRALYGTMEKSGAVEGRILLNVDGGLSPANGAHVWIEELTTGRVVAETTTAGTGRFSMSAVPVGDYRAMVEYPRSVPSVAEAVSVVNDRRTNQRVFRSVEMRPRLRVAVDKSTLINHVLVPSQNASLNLNARFVGMNGELSTVSVPAKPGQTITLYVGGEGVDQVPGTALVFNSSFINVEAATLTREASFNSTPVVSFSVAIDRNTPPGDYTLRLQSNSGEVAYVVGAVKILPSR